MFAIVGLGNPGSNFFLTKHNIGFRVVDLLIDRFCLPGRKKKFYELFLYAGGSEDIIFVKPLVYMNKSGVAVKKLIEEFDIPLHKLLVICDDFNLPVGKLRLRRKGSDGGQKGLASIIMSLNNNNFPRLRCGIGLFEEIDATEYVLSPFSEEQKRNVEKMIRTAGNAVIDFCRKGIDWTMNYYN
ncbi:MAG: aminoacyl-tRNA hydrolase [bacterium]